MMRLVGSLSSCYQPRVYIVAETDKMSADKIVSFENTKKEKDEETSEVLYIECVHVNEHTAVNTLIEFL